MPTATCDGPHLVLLLASAAAVSLAVTQQTTLATGMTKVTMKPYWAKYLAHALDQNQWKVKNALKVNAVSSTLGMGTWHGNSVPWVGGFYRVSKKSSPLAFFADFSKMGWNFNMKFYTFIESVQ